MTDVQDSFQVTEVQPHRMVDVLEKTNRDQVCRRRLQLPCVFKLSPGKLFNRSGDTLIKNVRPLKDRLAAIIKLFRW